MLYLNLFKDFVILKLFCNIFLLFENLIILFCKSDLLSFLNSRPYFPPSNISLGPVGQLLEIIGFLKLMLRVKHLEDLHILRKV